MDRRVPTHLLQAPELQGHTEEEVYQVVQALAESGYPDPTPDDIANVFRYVGSERDEPRSPVDEEEEVEEYVQPHHHHRVEDPSHPSSMPPHPAVMQDAMRMLHTTTPTTATATPATAGHTSRGGHGIMVQHQQQHKPRPTTAITRGGARAAWNANTAIDEPPAHRRRAMEAADRHRGGPARSSSAVLLNPTTRLERYVKKYERALNGFYERHPHMMIDPTSAEGWQPPSSRVALRNISNQHRDVYAEKGEEVYGMSGGPARHVLSMPLHHDGPSASTARRTANLIYDHTGDARYRFRPAPHDPTPLSGASGRLYATSATPRHRGQPLSSLAVGHLHADGSTLARRADPVRRGEEMRAMWRRDRFLSGGK